MTDDQMELTKDQIESIVDDLGEQIEQHIIDSMDYDESQRRGITTYVPYGDTQVPYMTEYEIELEEIEERAQTLWEEGKVNFNKSSGKWEMG